jgi:REP element-mobilizing transposase RayT
LHHVIVRGIERCSIFFDDQDRDFFLRRFSDLLQQTRTYCLAWALLPNHIHLLLGPRTKLLSTFMRHLLAERLGCEDGLVADDQILAGRTFAGSCRWP